MLYVYACIMSSCLEESQQLKDKIIDCLMQQISEFELLKSMYPNPDEVVLMDSKVLDNIQDFLDSKTEYTPKHLDFVVNLQVNGLKLEMYINLPSFYPTEEPDIYVRCNQLNRHQETLLNSELSNYIKDNYFEEVCLYTAISWLQENIVIFVKDTRKEPNNDDEINIEEDKFVRYWIYSHHIYNKKKREEILKLAKELYITGFCVPGKPGIICIEGALSNCEDWWRYIKSMNWKKIVIRKTEVFDTSEQNKEQKFCKFEELHFSNASTRHSKHANMSEFYKFMEKHKLSHSFNEFFGLCNDV